MDVISTQAGMEFSKINTMLAQIYRLTQASVLIYDSVNQLLYLNDSINSQLPGELLAHATLINEDRERGIKTYQLCEGIIFTIITFSGLEISNINLLILPYTYDEIDPDRVSNLLLSLNMSSQATETILNRLVRISETDMDSVISLLLGIASLRTPVMEESSSCKSIKQFLYGFSEAYILCDSENKIVLWNKNCSYLLEYETQEAEGRYLYELLAHGKLQEKFLNEINELKEKPDKLDHNWQLFPLKTKSGTIKQYFIIPSEIIIDEKTYTLYHINNKERFNLDHDELVKAKLDIIAKKERLDLLNKELDDSRDILIQAINKIDTSKDVFYNLFSNLKEGFSIFEIVYDKLNMPFDYFLVDANKAFEEFLNNDIANLIGRSGNELFKTAHNLLIKNIRKVLCTDKPVSFEIYLPQSSKNCLVSVYNYDTNKIAVLLKDISEKIRTQNILKDSQEKFNTILDSLSDAVVIVDPTGVIKNWNKSAERLFSFAKEQVAYKTFQHTLINENYQDYFEKIFEEYRTEGYSEIFETTVDMVMVKKHKTEFHASICFKPLLISNSNLLMICIKDISYLKNAEKLLKSGEEKYKTLLNNLPVPFLELEYNEINSEFVVIACNEAFENNENVHLSDRSKNTLEQILPKFAHSNVFKEIKNVYTEQTSFIFRDYKYTYDEKDYWIEGFIIPANNNNLLFIYNDITKQKLKDVNLKLLEIAIDNSMLPTCILDIEGNYKLINQAMIDIRGYDREEFLKMSIFDTIQGMTSEALDHIVKQLKTKGTHSVIATINKKDGSTFDGEVHISYIKFDDKDYMYCYTVNLTEKLKIEQNLKLLKFCIDNSLVPSAIVDIEGKIIEISKYSVEIFNIGKENNTDLTVFDVFKDLKEEKWSEMLQNLRQKQFVTFETTILSKDNTYLKCLINASLVKFENKELIYIQGLENTSQINQQQNLVSYSQYIEKMLEQKTTELNISLEKLGKANTELQIANKYKERFLSTISHELRTPLNGIIGFSDLLRNGYAGDLNKQQSEYMNLINNSSQNLLGLINDILDLVKIESDKAKITVEKFTIGEVIDSVVRLIKPQYDIKNIALKYSEELCSEEILADKRCCKHILFNFLSNSLKFTNAGGEVVINIDKLDDYVKISVQDNGIGISDKYKDKIFKDFYQPGWIKTQAIGGTGIGLALSKKLVEVQNGVIGFESKENIGSTFWFKIPV